MSTQWTAHVTCDAAGCERTLVLRTRQDQREAKESGWNLRIGLVSGSGWAFCPEHAGGDSGE